MRKFSLLIVLSVLALQSPALSQFSPAYADIHCTQDVCVDVSTDPATGKITIHATKERAGSTTTPHPKPQPKPQQRPQPKPRPAPRPTPRATPRKSFAHKVVSQPAQHLVRKRATPKPTPIAVPAISLSDQLTQLIPDSQIGITPSTGLVTHLPIYFSTTAPAIFATQSLLLGISVGISLTPIYTWDYGDGTTDLRFAPETVNHSYTKAGTFTVRLTISWSGTWSANGYTYQVLGGAIVQSFSSTLVVHEGPTQYKK